MTFQGNVHFTFPFLIRNLGRTGLRVAALIPAYNAAKGIRGVIKGLLRYFRQEDIFVVDDGSTDGTAHVAQELGVNVGRHPKNLGKGEALKTGFAGILKGNYDAVITLDGDGQHDPTFIPRFKEKALGDKVDVIIGRRKACKSMPPHRIFSNKTTSLVLSLLTRQTIPDSQSGYRLIRCCVLKDVKLKTSKYDTESELLIQAARKGYRIGYVPIDTLYPPGVKSSIHNLRDSWRFIKLILKNLR